MVKNFIWSTLLLLIISPYYCLTYAAQTWSIQPKQPKYRTSVSSSAKKSIIKLYPQIRTELENNHVDSIPVSLLKTFMDYPTILENNVIKNAPYIISNSKNTYFYSPGDTIYADNIQRTGRYIIYRVGQDILDPETGEPLGKEIIYNGEAMTVGPKNSNKTLIRDTQAQKRLGKNERYSSARIFGKKAPPFIRIPTKVAQPLIVTKAISEITQGDKLLFVPEDSHERFNFTPHQVTDNVQAQIIHIFEGVADQYIGKYQTILLNKGTTNGMDKGAVVSIYTKIPNKVWVDSSNIKKIMVKNIAFPVNLVGKAMVYSVSDNLAYAVVLEQYNSGNIRVGSFVSGPGHHLEDVPQYEPTPSSLK